MPQFHFNVRTGLMNVDEVGVDLPDIEAAMVMANHDASHLLRDEGEHLYADGEWQLEVTDAAGLILFTLMFSRCCAPAIGSGR